MHPLYQEESYIIGTTSHIYLHTHYSENYLIYHDFHQLKYSLN